MNAQFAYDGRIHTFQVSIGLRPDGRIGPPLEVVVAGTEAGQYAIQRKHTRWRVVYDRVDSEHDRLVYRVVEVL